MLHCLSCYAQYLLEGAIGVKKSVSGPLQLQLQAVLSCHVCTGNSEPLTDKPFLQPHDHSLEVILFFNLTNILNVTMNYRVYLWKILSC